MPSCSTRLGCGDHEGIDSQAGGPAVLGASSHAGVARFLRSLLNVRQALCCWASSSPDRSWRSPSASMTASADERVLKEQESIPALRCQNRGSGPWVTDTVTRLPAEIV